MNIFDPFGHAKKISKAVGFNIFDPLGLFAKPATPGDPAPLPPPPVPVNQPRTEAFATREQTTNRQAVAAGATRSDNDADLLGYTEQIKRRGASRDILG